MLKENVISLKLTKKYLQTFTYLSLNGFKIYLQFAWWNFEGKKEFVCTFPEVIFWFDLMTNDCLDTFQINHPRVILDTQSIIYMTYILYNCRSQFHNSLPLCHVVYQMSLFNPTKQLQHLKQILHDTT